MGEPLGMRRRPCSTCPYRRDVPAGVWSVDEYAKLPGYDGETHEQTNVAAFQCHQNGGGDVCAGWLGHRDPDDLLAVRFAMLRGVLPPEAVEYSTDVPLFATGLEAAAHGVGGVEHPDERAMAAIGKLIRQRAVTGGDPGRRGRTRRGGGSGAGVAGPQPGRPDASEPGAG